MCGIVGLISKNANGFILEECDLFTNMLQMDTIRGKDATGVFGIDKDSHVDIIKADTNAWQFTQCNNYKEFERRIYSNYLMVIGHNRAATKGSLNAHNAHPFKEEHITLVHNGTIYNQDELDSSVEVDSHAITKALAKANATEGLESIHGPFALVWYDSKLKTLNLARNNGRPLFVIEWEQYWTISSEPGLPYWLNGRDGKKAKGHPRIVPEKKILQMPLEERNRPFLEVNYEEYVYVAPPPLVPVKTTYNMHQHSHLRQVPTHTNNKDLPFKAGDTVVFKVDDIKHEINDIDYTIFGHPVFDNEIDENILVKTDTRLKSTADALQAGEFAAGTLTSITDMNGMPVLYIRFAEPCRIDAAQNMSVDADIKKAIASGCNRCKGVMAFTDIANSIVRKKKDGTYRTLCAKCLQESKDKIPSIGSQAVAH